MDDLVERLRENAIREGFVDNLDIVAADCITEQATEIEQLRAALQLIAADITGNKHHQSQYRQDTASAALEAKDEGYRRCTKL